METTAVLMIAGGSLAGAFVLKKVIDFLEEIMWKLLKITAISVLFFVVIKIIGGGILG